jgi:hypothetical protein
MPAEAPGMCTVDRKTLPFHQRRGGTHRDPDAPDTGGDPERRRLPNVNGFAV